MSPKTCVMCVLGLGLHEAGHVLHTRDGFRRMARGLSLVRRCYDNLWEDGAMNLELVRRDSPGFASYLQAAKRALLEQGQPGQALKNWDSLVDLDKVNVLLFAFIRLPHLVDDRIKSWSMINGECIFDTLRQIFPAGPADETDVERFAIECERLWKRLTPSTPTCLAGATGSGPVLSWVSMCDVPRSSLGSRPNCSPMPRTGRLTRRYTTRVARPITRGRAWWIAFWTRQRGWPMPGGTALLNRSSSSRSTSSATAAA